jgi:hypothetical protein
MKVATLIKSLAMFISVFFSISALAYSPEMEEGMCKKPKYREFSLIEYKTPEFVEVAPESEFTFTLSVWANKETIKITAKNQSLPYTVESTSSYHRVKAKLPASLNGQFVRINSTVKAMLGCHEEAGWLIKVAEKK